MIVVVDYMMGNLRSVLKACLLTKKDVIITAERKKILAASKIILPGVGAFADAVRELKKLKLFDLLKEKIACGTPFLGVCLGMQLLFSRSQEAPGVRGLGIVEGEVKRFSNRLKVPQIGWNQLEIRDRTCKLFKGIKNKSFVYFCHSFYCQPKDKRVIAAGTFYGRSYCSVLSKGNIYGVQFHPEKSQKTGLKILSNFLK
ncbi:MAG: imidazole glycerol phosphate synthase subunit HisH [Candidatus Omnitrophica bacterium]|nr:imidazole glycerol phosphate synthase subunit HisH [Candidatus Omnitrophota bacterium]